MPQDPLALDPWLRSIGLSFGMGKRLNLLTRLRVSHIAVRSEITNKSKVQYVFKFGKFN